MLKEAKRSLGEQKKRSKTPESFETRSSKRYPADKRKVSKTNSNEKKENTQPVHFNKSCKSFVPKKILDKTMLL